MQAQVQAFDKGRIQGFGSSGMKEKVWQCPQGHLLQPWTAQPGTCDGCHKRVLKGDKVMDCRPCNYYLCESCHPQEQGGSLWGVLSSAITMAAEEMSEMASDVNSSLEAAVSVITCSAPSQKDLKTEEIALDKDDSKAGAEPATSECETHISPKDGALPSSATSGDEETPADSGGEGEAEKELKDLMEFERDDLLDFPDAAPQADAEQKEGDLLLVLADSSKPTKPQEEEGGDLLELQGAKPLSSATQVKEAESADLLDFDAQPAAAPAPAAAVPPALAAPDAATAAPLAPPPASAAKDANANADLLDLDGPDTGLLGSGL